MDQTLAVYLPVDRRHALATGIPLLERTQGTALFADISGFTPLTEALTRDLGARRGAEELPRQLNVVYDALICEVDRYGGSVIGFAGDAITCWFDGDAGLRAIACGLAMQAAMRAFATVQLPSGGTASLAMKVAVAAGAVRRFLVGDPRVQLIDALAGATLTRMTAAEQQALKGELVLDERTAHALSEGLDFREWRTDEQGARFAVVAGLRESVAPQPWATLDPGHLTTDELRPWLLPTVYERLQAGQGEFLTELRPAVALFLRFGGIDYDTDSEAGAKLDAFIRWVQGILVQYEGTLIQLTIGEKGSYLYAAFGAPIAHEDDARRAALTALALRTPPEELSFISEIQIGLTRGTMRAGAYGGTTRRTYGSLGDEVNLAARLMQHARPGQIIASGRVHDATATLFTWQVLEDIRVKGKTDPIPVYALQGQTPPTTIHLTEPTYTLPMIGRQAELAVIEQKLGLAYQGQGQMIGITGEAGMGKSRLVAEVIRLAQAQGFAGYGGECQSFGTHTPYLVWQPIWRAFFALDERATPEEQAAQAARAIRELDPTLLGRLPLLAPVLGLSLEDNELTRTFSPDLRKASREALLVDLLKARARYLRAEGGALLLVLEDCHWLDGASHDLLETIGRAIWNLPVLIVLAYRPPELERLEAPRVSSLAHFTLLSLAELDAPEVASLMTRHLAQLYPQETRQPPAGLVSQLAARAQGNPFYLEELLNYLHDQGLDPFEAASTAHLELPTSLHSLILSRIDRLTEAQKVTLKVASIIGRLFRFRWLMGYYPALGDGVAVRRDLEALSRLDLTPLERPEPDLIYLFKHIVTREVAYESLPYATRAQLHEQLAAFLEAREAEAVEGYLDLLAHHYALSENHEKQCHYLRLAGERAQAAFANDAAQAYYAQLLPLLQDRGEQIEIHLRLGAVLERVGQWVRAEEQYHAVLSLGQASTWAQGVQALGMLYYHRGQYEEAHTRLTQALDQWEILGEPEGASQALRSLGILAWRQGDYRRALDYLERSREDCRARGDQAGLAATLNSLGIIMSRQGDFAAAQAMYEESLLLNRALGQKRGTAGSLNNLGIVALKQGNYEVAQLQFEECLALFREMGDKLGIAMTLNNLGSVTLSQEKYELARAFIEESVILKREMGDKEGIASSLSNLGVVACYQGRYAEGRSLQEESLARRREVGDKGGIAISLRHLGLVAYRQADSAGAQRYYHEGLTVAHSILEKIEITHMLIGLATLASTAGTLLDRQRATRLLGAAEALRQAVGLTLNSQEQRFYNEALAATRIHLSESDFAAAWAEGEAMSLDEAVALALAESSHD